MIYSFTRDLSDRKSIAAVESLQWTEKYSGIGTFSIVAGDNEKNISALQKGNILYYNGYTGVIQQVVYDAGKITANGSALAVLLNQRIILNDATIENVESSLYDAWTANARGLDVEAATPSGLEETFPDMVYGVSFGDYAASVCEASDLGLRVRLDVKTKQKTFEIYKGKDLSSPTDPKAVVFSTSKNTLSGLQINDDDSTLANVAVVYGTDDTSGTEQRIVEVVGTETGVSRREIAVDATSTKPEKERKEYDENGEEIGTLPAETIEEYRQRLRAKGLEALQERVSRLNFTASVSSRDYNRRFTLGDKIRCYSAKYGLHLTARITETHYTIDREKESITLTLGNPKLSFERLVKLWQT